MRTVLITGVGKGIGKALAAKFLSEGFYVIGTYYSGEIPAHENMTVFRLDLSNAKGINNCIAEILRLGKKIDILINNAGVLIDENETRVLTDKLRKTLEVNLIGTIDFTEKLIPQVNPGSHIINISSTAGSLELAGDPAKSHFPYHYPAYKISKAGLNMYTRILAESSKEIIVSSVHPGWVKTDMGGEEAEVLPEEAAEDIYKFAISKPESGKFWFRGRALPW